MKRKYINVTKTVDVDVDIDVSDYIEDVLEQAEDKELITELQKRGYSFSKPQPMFEPANASECKRFFCSLLGLSYFTSEENLLNEIKRYLK